MSGKTGGKWKNKNWWVGVLAERTVKVNRGWHNSDEKGHERRRIKQKDIEDIDQNTDEINIKSEENEI